MYDTLISKGKQGKKTKALRKKMFHFHLQGNFDLELFIEMDAKILLTLISWIGKYYNAKDPENGKSRGSAFYRILQSFPELCSYPSAERKLRLQRLKWKMQIINKESNNCCWRLMS